MTYSRVFFVIVVLSFAASGCGWFGGWFSEPAEGSSLSDLKQPFSPPPVRLGTTQTELIQAEHLAPSEFVVEVLWKTPEVPVQKYYLSYGPNPTYLDYRVEIDKTDLTQIDHPQYGSVYRYELKGVDTKGPIYISLQAKNEHGISPPSKPFRLLGKEGHEVTEKRE